MVSRFMNVKWETIKSINYVQRTCMIVHTENTRLIYVDYTYKCNLSCLFCASDGTHSPTTVDYTIGSFEEFFKVASDCNILHISGGEPTLGDNFIDFCNLARKKFKYILLSTNGITFSDESFVKDVLNTGIDKVIVPYISSKETIFESIVGVKGAFKRFIKGLQNLTRLHNSSVTFVIKVLPFAWTIDEIEVMPTFWATHCIRPDEVQISGLHISTRLAQHQELLPDWSKLSESISRLINVLVEQKYCFSIIDLPWCLFDRIILEKLLSYGKIDYVPQMPYTKVYRSGIRESVYEPHRFAACTICQVTDFCNSIYPRNVELIEPQLISHLKPIFFDNRQE